MKTNFFLFILLSYIYTDDNEQILFNENEHASLFSGKKFSSWEECEKFLDDWSKAQGFHIIKDRVTRNEGVIHRRTFICSHSRTYESHSTKDTATKKLNCPFSINISCPKNKNPEGFVTINKINETHNHPLNRQLIEFEEAKKFTPEMIEDVKFMTIYCKFGATAQRKFLEGKFPSHPIYSKDLYAVIQKFRPSAKSLSNDAAQVSNWLDQEKEKDSRWVVVRGWDDDNTLTYLFWMTPIQVENWIHYSDCVINDVTHKTNRYGMALSLIVGFNNNRRNILLAQALLIDESLESHVWMFTQLTKSTGLQPLVIITDADPAVDAAIRQAFPSAYPIHCAYHINQNLHKNLGKLLGDNYKEFLAAFYKCRNCIVENVFQQRFDSLINDYPNAKSYLEFLYKTKSYWAHCFIKFKFTGGMIASSRVESVNACLKRLLHNSNVPLCDLMLEVQRLLDLQDKENEYNFWRLSIPNIHNQQNSNFLFTKVDQIIEQYLTPMIVKKLREEMNQSVYYMANRVELNNEIIEELKSVDNEPLDTEFPQITLNEMVQFIGLDNIREIWSISIGNSSKIKHYVLLLQNLGYICSCLSIIQSGIVCRHYFQVMLTTKEAAFHIKFIPTRWYSEDKDCAQESFLTADRFMQECIFNTTNELSASGLCFFDEINTRFCEKRLTVLEQRTIYGKLHGMYKKALNKVLQNSSNSEQLINLLEDFVEDGDDNQSDSEDIPNEYESSGKENLDPSVLLLQNPKKKRGKGRPLGTKRFKSSCESSKPNTKGQRRCKKCGGVGHYQKNCKI